MVLHAKLKFLNNCKVWKKANNQDFYSEFTVNVKIKNWSNAMLVEGPVGNKGQKEENGMTKQIPTNIT